MEKPVNPLGKAGAERIKDVFQSNRTLLTSLRRQERTKAPVVTSTT